MTAQRDTWNSVYLFALGALILTLTPLLLPAQSYHSAFGYGGKNTGPVAYCGSLSTTQGEGSTQVDCIERDVAFIASSSNIGGKVSGRAELTFDSATLPLEHSALYSVADAQWVDRLFVGPSVGNPSFVQFQMLFEGGILSEAFGYSGGNSRAGAAWYFGAVNETGNLLASYSNGVNLEAGLGFGPRSEYAVNDVQAFTVPISSDGWVDFGYRLRLDAYWFNLGGEQTNPSADVRLNFSNSAKLVGLDFFSADMTRLTNAQYSFQNGTQIFAAAAVPEPTTWMLLLAGMLALFGFRGLRGELRIGVPDAR